MSTKQTLIHLWVALLLTSAGHAAILGTTATGRPDNSRRVDIQVVSHSKAARVAVTYEADGVESLVSKWASVERDGTPKITIGRLRANRTYTYSVHAIDNYGGSAGTTA